MILQALVRLYEALAAQDRIARSGWSRSDITFALCIDGDGKLERLVDLRQEVPSGKKMVLRPRSMTLPAAVKRSSGVAANFLWDNAGYLLGIDDKGKPERTRQCFEACGALHREALDGMESPVAKAILRFFETWKPEEEGEHPAIQEHLDRLYAGGNLTFRVDGQFAADDPDIRAAWQKRYDAGEGETMQCLVTGQKDLIEPVHPSVKGLRGGQSSGGALVSFNAPAFCSYGREQSYNAPVGKYAAFAYTSALNYLLADKNNVYSLGDASVLFWAEGGEPAFQDMMGAMTFGKETRYSDGDLRDMAKKLVEGKPVDFDGTKLDPNTTFYILAISPNAARISVRFFLRNSFGHLLENVTAHHERIEIVRPSYEKFDTLPLWAMLRETVNLNSKDKSPSPILAGAVARAIFSGERYPAALLEQTMLRIRAERSITRGRAAILKAYYLKNETSECPKEVLTVSLNEASTNPAYTLGRLFSVYEALQESANPGINATIRDRYFNSAMSSPGTIFPTLDKLAKAHLRKLDKGLRISYEKQIGTLKEVFSESYPARLTLPQQGSFDLGYYHQTQKRYTKKEEVK